MKTLNEKELASINGGDGWGLAGLGIGLVGIGIAIICAPVSVPVLMGGFLIGAAGDALVQEGLTEAAGEQNVFDYSNT